MSGRILLRGITWNHSRALLPLVATAQRFEELHPDVEIRWEKRSLHEFGHADLTPLAREFDLLVVDHPMMGLAYDCGALVDLQSLLPGSFLDDLAETFVGQSYQSYLYSGNLFALPIDAAAPAASYRPDILSRTGLELPSTWNDLLHLARRGVVVMPAFPADLFLNFMGLCVSKGSQIAKDPEQLVDDETGKACLEQLRDLAAQMPDIIYQLNPIALYEYMAVGDRFAYCPFAYSYSNYSRAGFARNVILYRNPILLEPARPLRTVLGGTGLAISSRRLHIEIAVEYAAWVAGEQCQRTLYGLSGGQPANRAAWTDDTLNAMSNGFFRQTLQSMNSAYMRPRYRGYIELQEKAGEPIQDYLRRNGSTVAVLANINALYRKSRINGSMNTHA